MKLAIIGTGLIGGSIALKAKATGFASHIVGIDTNKAHLDTALQLNIIDEAADLHKGISETDLIILAVPVNSATLLLPKILEMINSRQTVMDVGSTKSSITEAVKTHLNRSRFVAFHPMWGTENSGPEAATAISFASKAAVICDREFSASDALETAERLANTLEMNVLHMDSAAHDLHTAYISHISHITSYALANTVLEKEKEEDTIFQLASSGFSSTVRLAKSHPEMWVPIFQQNRENVLDVLNEHISQLSKFKTALEKENYDYLEELIRNANKIRPILVKK